MYKLHFIGMGGFMVVGAFLVCSVRARAGVFDDVIQTRARPGLRCRGARAALRIGFATDFPTEDPPGNKGGPGWAELGAGRRARPAPRQPGEAISESVWGGGSAGSMHSWGAATTSRPGSAPFGAEAGNRVCTSGVRSPDLV